MKIVKYVVSFGLGFLAAVAAAIALTAITPKGVTLDRDVTIYGEEGIVAVLREGARFNRSVFGGRCSFEFYLDAYDPETHEAVEPYYRDRPFDRGMGQRGD